MKILCNYPLYQTFGINGLRSKNGVLIKLKYYWHFYSDIKINIERIFKCDYDVEDVFDNCYDAILSRIDFIERNEPRSSYLNVVF